MRGEKPRRERRDKSPRRYWRDYWVRSRVDTLRTRVLTTELGLVSIWIWDNGLMLAWTVINGRLYEAAWRNMWLDKKAVTIVKRWQKSLYVDIGEAL